MDELVCSWCEFTKSLYSRDIEAELIEFIESLPAEAKVTQAVHAQRVAICSSCKDCQDGVCRYCGCYVATRTVQKSMSCPKVGKAEW